MSDKELIQELLSKPKELIKKQPFTRGLDREDGYSPKTTVEVGEALEACLPRIKKRIVSQEQFLRELDPKSHTVLFDDNIPSFCVKLNDGKVSEIKHEKVAIPFQKLIKDKQVMHLTANPMQFTLMDLEPTDEQQKNFIDFKQYWDLRNQDGMKTKFVDAQLSVGDAGLLYYFDSKGQIKSRLLSYMDGFVLCPHNNQDGDRILECVYYCSGDYEYIDCYDDTYMYRYSKSTLDGVTPEEGTIEGWTVEAPKKHGFVEIPLITKRGEVAWNKVQTAIEGYEALYNILLVSIKKYGYNILYVKGKFADNGKRVAGAMILNDTSMDGTGDAKFLEYPQPAGAMDTLELMKENIQLGSSTTFLLPDDVKTGGDVAGIAIQLVQSLDLELAHQKVIEWQNVADKMVRLFKYGLAVELVNNGDNPQAITQFEELKINAKFKVWKPLNEYEYNQIITMLQGAGVLSKESAIELNTMSKPDEKHRVQKETEEAERKAQEQFEQQAALSQQKEGNEGGEGASKNDKNKKEGGED